jgi:hypothetical protein
MGVIYNQIFMNFKHQLFFMKFITLIMNIYKSCSLQINFFFSNTGVDYSCRSVFS